MANVPLAPSHLLSISDGDTPEVKMGIRMLGIDAPELHFPGTQNPADQDGLLAGLPKTAEWKGLPKGLRDHLEGRLEGGGTREARWGLAAKEAFEAMVKEALRQKGAKGPRQLFMLCGPEVFDCYGRILAYVGPYVPRAERAGAPPPDTFNLRMLASGMAAPCLHAGNIPKPADLAKAAAAVQAARKGKLGFWQEADRILHGYEFRALVRLGTGLGGFRYKVADLREHSTAVTSSLPATEYYEIPEEYRLFF